MQRLAATNTEIHLNTPALQEKPQRHEREALRLGLHPELEDFLRMNQQFPLATRLVIKAVAELIGGDVAAHQPQLPSKHRAISPRKRHLSVTDRFNLGSSQHNTALDCLEYGIVMSCLAVFAEDRIELLVRHLIGKQAVHVDVLLIPLRLGILRLGDSVEIDFRDQLAFGNFSQRNVTLVNI